MTTILKIITASLVLAVSMGAQGSGDDGSNGSGNNGGSDKRVSAFRNLSHKGQKKVLDAACEDPDFYAHNEAICPLQKDAYVPSGGSVDPLTDAPVAPKKKHKIPVYDQDGNDGSGSSSGQHSSGGDDYGSGGGSGSHHQSSHGQSSSYNDSNGNDGGFGNDSSASGSDDGYGSTSKKSSHSNSNGY